MAVTKVGIVDSTKLEKTVVVKVERKVRHPFYKKLITKTTRFKAHDDLGVQTGQKVRITETKPRSRDIHFIVSEVIK